MMFAASDGFTTVSVHVRRRLQDVIAQPPLDSFALDPARCTRHQALAMQCHSRGSLQAAGDNTLGEKALHPAHVNCQQPNPVDYVAYSPNDLVNAVKALIGYQGPLVLNLVSISCTWAVQTKKGFKHFLEVPEYSVAQCHTRRGPHPWWRHICCAVRMPPSRFDGWP